jgi:hypothetical protein
MKKRPVIGIALSFLLLAAAPAYAGQECTCEDGGTVETTSDDPAGCDAACADHVGSRSVHRPPPGGGGEPDRSSAPAPDDDVDPSTRMP